VSNLRGDASMRGPQRPLRRVVTTLASRILCSSSPRSQRGTALAELALVTPLLCLLLCGSIDLGRIFYASIEVANAAHAGAAYGARTVSLANDTAGMKTAALNDAPDYSSITAAGSYVCQCPSTGTNVNCTNWQGNCLAAPQILVTVTTSMQVYPMIPWPGVPNPVTVSSSATIRAR